MESYTLAQILSMLPGRIYMYIYTGELSLQNGARGRGVLAIFFTVKFDQNFSN